MICLDQYRIVLVEPEKPINVGTVMRAMKNMGFHNLYLVNPVEMDLQQTQISAHHSEDMLSRIVIVKTLEEALDGIRESYGFSARQRSKTWASLDLASATSRSIQLVKSEQKVAYVFGRERTGLTNEELDACHCRVHIETADYASLNLAQAVLLAMYEATRQLRTNDVQSPAELPALDSHAPNTLPATCDDISRLMSRIENMLVEIGFFKSQDPNSALRRLKNIVQRADLHDDEVRLLLGVCAEVTNYAQLIERGIRPDKIRPK